MATTKTEVNALLARCRKVGWTVEQASNGHRVIFDDGSPYLIHSSYSDINAPKRVLQFLMSKGLIDKENEQKVSHAAQKAETLSAQRKSAAATARKLAKQSELTAKAAGPYAAPEEVPLDWYLANHPAPWARPVIIDPSLAAALLKRNIDNRPIRPATVDYYHHLIVSGRWHLTHQGMAMDVRGVLQDGQHRLKACVKADTAIETFFFVGMPVENFKAIDEGRNRSIADLLGKDEVADRNLVGVTLRLIAAYREPFPRAFLKVKTSNEFLYDSFKGDPDRFTEAVAWARKNYARAKVVGGALAAAAYLLREANGQDNQFVTAFLGGLVTGTKGSTRVLLDVDDPRLLLRNAMQERRERGNRMRGIDQLGFILLAWNLVVDRSQYGKRIKWHDGQDDIPQIIVCKDKGRTASAVPDKLRGEFTE